MLHSLLSVTDLCVWFATEDGDIAAVKALTFTMEQDETLGIIGELDSGKSQTAFALMGLLAANEQASDSARFIGHETLNLQEKSLNKLRAKEIAMIFRIR
ncbi:MAG: hypothetical protein ACR5LD_01720 [Symbiopectobacterium sp.]